MSPKGPSRAPPCQPRAALLVKSEPSSYSIDDLKRERRTAWSEVRNFQARNFMQEMEVGDLLLVYHSSPATLPDLRS